MSVRVRFAPSPTGYLHIGGLRTALYCYLYAKKMGGEYILRIEDTDQGRKVDDAVEKLIRVMVNMDLLHDEGPFLTEDNKIYQKGDCGPYIQSQKIDRYKEIAKELIDKGNAYYCFCSAQRLEFIREEQKKNNQTHKYDGLCRNIDKEEAEKRIENNEPYVIRLKLPENTIIKFKDHVRGEVSFNTNDLDDQVLIKQDGFPTYHMAVVVDDNDMKVTHVLRGEEWLSSTPKHVFLYEALGYEKPEYIHLPLILNSQKKKLSKRHDDVAVEDFLKKGYLKEALINYVSLVGWSPSSNKEIMTKDEIIEEFSLERLNNSSAVFDVEKLTWMNSIWIQNYDDEKLLQLVKPYLYEEKIIDKSVDTDIEWLLLLIKSLKQRARTLKEFAEKSHIFVENEFEIEESAVEELKLETAKIVLEKFLDELLKVDKLTEENSKVILKNVQINSSVKGKLLFMPIRAALAGSLHGVDMANLLTLIGKENCIERVKKVLNNM